MAETLLAELGGHVHEQFDTLVDLTKTAEHKAKALASVGNVIASIEKELEEVGQEFNYDLNVVRGQFAFHLGQLKLTLSKLKG